MNTNNSVERVAHAWEQTHYGRNKGPIPHEYIWAYDGPSPRPVPQS